MYEGGSGTIEGKRDWWDYHMWINVVCWGFLIDFPIVVARYFKTKSWYIAVHWISLTLLMGGSKFAEFAMIYTSS